MALVAITGFDRDRKSRPVGDAGVAQCAGVLAAGTVAIFALDIGNILELGRYRRPIAIGYLGWERPPNLRHHIVETAIDCIRIGIIADGVALQAGFHIESAYAQVTVNALGKDARVSSGLPR